MDPNVALARVRAQLQRIYKSGVADAPEDVIDSFAEHFDGLDEWLTAGGFFPRAWTTPTRRGPRRGKDGGALDPNATLKVLRSRIKAILDDRSDDWGVTEALRGFDTLDHWMSAGGYVPTAWMRRKR